MVSNTNMLIAGNIGWGKTNTAMAIAVRNIPFGRRIVVPGDPKDDWLRLALALGGQGIRLGRGLQARLNPLDGGVKPAGQDQAVWDSEVWNRRQKLLIALVATAAPAIAPLEPLAVAALDLALAAAVAAQGTPTLPHVAFHLGNPDPQQAKDAGYSAELLRDRGQPVYAVLSSLIGGHLGGLFDGPSTVRFDPDAPMIALGSAALGEDDLLQSLVMLCASAWVGSTMADPRYGQRIFVYDEAWRIISGEAQLDRMNADLRLSRYYGIANIIAMHALSDPDKVGHADSAAVKKARGLLSLCDTRVVFRQAPGELDRATHDLALTAAEREVVAGAGVGEALWKLPTKSFRVQTVLSAREKAMFDTDHRMTTEGTRVMIGHRTRSRTRQSLRRQLQQQLSTIAEDGPRIADTARVAAGAKVTGRGRVGGQAVAVGAVTVADDARLTDHAILAGTATIRGRATLSGWATAIEKATPGWRRLGVRPRRHRGKRLDRRARPGLRRRQASTAVRSSAGTPGSTATPTSPGKPGCTDAARSAGTP